MSIAVTDPGARASTVTITGTPPGGPVNILLPIFCGSSVTSVTNGSYSAAAHTVTANSGATSITINLNN